MKTKMIYTLIGMVIFLIGFLTSTHIAFKKTQEIAETKLIEFKALHDKDNYLDFDGDKVCSYIYQISYIAKQLPLKHKKNVLDRALKISIDYGLFVQEKLKEARIVSHIGNEKEYTKRANHIINNVKFIDIPANNLTPPGYAYEPMLEEEAKTFYNLNKRSKEPGFLAYDN